MSTVKHRQMIQRYNKERQRNILAQSGPNDFAVVLDGLKAGFNVAKIFRSADAFGAASVHLVNIGPFDPSPAKGSFRKVPALFHDDFTSCYQHLTAHGYSLFCLAPEAASDLTSIVFPRKSAFIFGHEEFGHSFEPMEYPDVESITIPQFGSVQSLNVSIAASIVMFEHVRQHPTSDS